MADQKNRQEKQTERAETAYPPAPPKRNNEAKEEARHKSSDAKSGSGSSSGSDAKSSCTNSVSNSSDAKSGSNNSNCGSDNNNSSSDNNNSSSSSSNSSTNSIHSTTLKKHWSMTISGSLVARANTFMHRKLITPAKHGGMKDFMEKHCHLFDEKDADVAEAAESADYTIEQYARFQEYEAQIEAALEEFATEEKCDGAELLELCQTAQESDKQADKSVQLLVGVGSYSKFVKLMKLTAAKKRAAAATVADK